MIFCSLLRAKYTPNAAPARTVQRNGTSHGAAAEGGQAPRSQHPGADDPLAG